MNEGQEVPHSLVIASCNSAKLLDFIDKPLKKISLLVDMQVDTSRLFAVLLRRNDNSGTFGFNLFYELIAVISLLGND